MVGLSDARIKQSPRGPAPRPGLVHTINSDFALLNITAILRVGIQEATARRCRSAVSVDAGFGDPRFDPEVGVIHTSEFRAPVF